MKYKFNVISPICLKTLLILTRNTHYIENKYHYNNTINVKEAEQQTNKYINIFFKIFNEIQKSKLTHIALIESQLTRILASMEYIGLSIKIKKWENLINIKKNILNYCIKKIKQQLKHMLNYNLFGETNINIKNNIYVKILIKKLLNQNMNNININNEKNINNNIIQLILKYRQIYQTIKIYGNNFLYHCNKKKNKIYGHFNSLQSSTHRISSYNVNLQNLPSSYNFKQCIYITNNKKTYISGDYNTYEFRILAGLANDVKLINMLNQNKDIHLEIAKKIFNTNNNKIITPNLRNKAKAINFSIIYDISIQSLAYKLQLSIIKTKHFLKNYFSQFPKIKEFLNNIAHIALQQGYIKTVLGRKLILPNTNTNIKQNHRIAKNMLIQGNAADIIKLAMINIHNKLITQFNQAYLVNMIHDELIIECLIKDTHKIAILLKIEMEKAQQLLIPNINSFVNIKINKTFNNNY